MSAVHIQLHDDCPHCGLHVLYHCETKEQIEQCHWYKDRYKKGVEDAVEFFRREFKKWNDNQFGVGQRCLSFSEMLEESIKHLLAER